MVLPVRLAVRIRFVVILIILGRIVLAKFHFLIVTQFKFTTLALNYIFGQAEAVLQIPEVTVQEMPAVARQLALERTEIFYRNGFDELTHRIHLIEFVANENRDRLVARNGILLLLGLALGDVQQPLVANAQSLREAHSE